VEVDGRVWEVPGNGAFASKSLSFLTVTAGIGVLLIVRNVLDGYRQF
jgi:hypothetical protein